MTNILDALNWRYAVKKFDENKKIPEEKIETLEESLRLSPSSFGLEAWKFFVVESQDLKEKLRDASYNQNQIAQASHVVVLCSKTDVSYDYIENSVNYMSENKGIDISEQDGFKEMIKGFVDYLKNNNQLQCRLDKQVYIALGFLLETAAYLGVDSCPIEGFKADEFDEILDLKSKGLKSTVVCPLGYRSDDDSFGNLTKSRLAKDDVIERI